jgi:enoyl-CoA hydratase/carnithine racemase
MDMLSQFESAIDYASNHKKVKVVALLSACEKAFTAGADVKHMSEQDKEGARHFSELGHRIARKLETMPQPVIMGIHGYALGGGMEFACACDIRLASEDAVFSQPEIDIGIIPGWGGTQRLSRIVGIAKAKEIIYTGKRLKAEEAYEIGLVNHILPRDELHDAVISMAKLIASKGKISLFDAKKAINMLHESFLEEGLAFEIDRWTEEFATYDQKEGMHAFLQKRPPEFQDR